MPSLLIKNLPPSLHDALKKRAAAHRRSLNNETIHILEQAMAQSGIPAPPTDSGPPPDQATLATLPPDIAQRLHALRQLRQSMEKRQVDFQAWRQTAYDSRR